MQWAMRIQINQNWCRSECVFQHIKHALLHCASDEGMVLLCEIYEWLGYAGELWDEPLVEVGHAKELPYALHIMRHLVILDCCYLCWVH